MCWPEYGMTLVVCKPTYTYVVHAYVYTYLYLCMCVCIYIYVCVYACMYARARACVCMYIYMYVCVCRYWCFSCQFHDRTDADLLVFLEMLVQFSVCLLIP